MSDLEMAIAMRKHLLEWTIEKCFRREERRYDAFMCGICNCYHAITKNYLRWDELAWKFPALAIQKPEPPFSYGAYRWPNSDYGFLCRMRAIRKFKNASKEKI